MSLPFKIRVDLTLSYFVILFFNYLQGLHVLPSSIHFVIFKNSFLLSHEDPREVIHTTGNNMMYIIHPWVLYMHVHCTSCPNTFINLAVQNPLLGLTSMTTTNLPTFKHVLDLLPPIMQDRGRSLKISLFYKNRITKYTHVGVF
jgi:hypothetical protein